MCGIVGYTGVMKGKSAVLEGLRRLEYRGYDSSGIALTGEEGICIVKTVGKVAALEERLASLETGETCCAIGHTRWATHGGVTETNAHPHMDCNNTLALVHNGIVENYEDLRAKLAELGISCKSETDTEVVAQTLGQLYQGDPLEAMAQLFKKLEGAFAFVATFADRPGELYCLRKGAPLVVALGSDCAMCASDVPAIAELSSRVIFLEEGELCRLTAGKAEFFTADLTPKTREERALDVSPDMIDKRGYAHFMLKEIHEQSSVARNVLEGRLEGGKLHLEPMLDLTKEEANALTALRFIACGSSCYAAQIASAVLERYLSVPLVVEVASEYRARPSKVRGSFMGVFVSQSGETSDTLAALRVAKERGALCVAVTNQMNSSIARESGRAVDLRAGIEVGVAATKTFTAQVLTLILFGLRLARLRDDVTDERLDALAKALASLPAKMEETLEYANETMMESVAKKFIEAKDFLFIGRGASFPVAHEGALKLKEISYVHAEAFAAGELKHGPIALLDVQTPTVVVAPDDDLLAKTLSNMQECIARKSPVLLVTSESVERREDVTAQISVPVTDPDLTPLLTVLPLQMFAYCYARLLGCEIDQPRNLAKSVTVE